MDMDWAHCILKQGQLQGPGVYNWGLGKKASGTTLIKCLNVLCSMLFMALGVQTSLHTHGARALTPILGEA